MFHGTPFQLLVGRVHTILQGEGCEPGDALMPLLFSLGQHSALHVCNPSEEGEVLMAFLDDTCTVSMSLLAGALWTEAGIRVHQGKPQVWNLAGENPLGATIWKGRGSDRRGIKVLGTKGFYCEDARSLRGSQSQ